jgi:phosphoribosylglycinamide formyltransferase-1
VVLVISDRYDAGINEVARRYHVQNQVLSVGSRDEVANEMVAILSTAGVELLVLAGYMKLLPPRVISALSGHVINVHPALLPKFGGKGMYGRRVHQAVVEAGERQTGATVHWVTEAYDEGQVISQRSIEIKEGEGAEQVEERVKRLEKDLLPETIEMLSKRGR